MFDIYLFNWTNPSDLNGKKDYQKPILEQLGPYRFREKHMKTRMEWHPHNYTVSYKRKGTYFFDEKGSKGRLNDKIVSINTFAAVSNIYSTEKNHLFINMIDFICRRSRKRVKIWIGLWKK